MRVVLLYTRLADYTIELGIMSLLSYDLLDGALPENPTFKVQFRHYRVIRPHFMIHAHKKNGAAYNGMNVEHPEHLVSAATSMVKEYKTELENDTILTLSIHTDDFASNIEEFHGQLCVEVATYLNVFHKLKCKLPKDVNIETYEKDVEKWSKRKSYVADDVDIIIKREDPNGPAQITEEDRIRTTRKLKEKNVFVFYHKKYPMIGFFTKANREKEDQFVSKHIKILMDYKDEYLKNYPKQPEEKRGYHLCFRPEGNNFYNNTICVILNKKTYSTA